MSVCIQNHYKKQSNALVIQCCSQKVKDYVREITGDNLSEYSLIIVTNVGKYSKIKEIEEIINGVTKSVSIFISIGKKTNIDIEFIKSSRIIGKYDKYTMYEDLE